ncbi:hypothetical protein G1C98_0661 [Bifidobacterium sp. DSM 109960]|uniref:Membrane associated protein n=1 Tax=Bifidobacterium erythrocebi TaxID=2675325 RepID=A0A7Y0HT80_9BIFI|nr:hypothetical protein [Bifidobacterium sp. DSM 109960]NMM95925.1 hypothetical protein [Bifidobacterium sp. DSM 109960]
MTDLNNTNAGDERSQHTPDGETGSGDLDAAWAAFEAEHQDDLNDVAESRNAKRFEKHAQRKEKEALLSVDDLTADSFAKTGATHGPRDFTGSSWLDTDDVMDRYGDDFVPPNPKIGPVKKSKAVFWILLIVGVAGVIASVFLPSSTGIIGTVCGVCVLLGAVGLIAQHKGHSETRTDYFDDGARV